MRFWDRSSADSGNLRRRFGQLGRLLCLALLLAGGPAMALDPARGIGQFHHTAWTVDQGAPGQVTALAQTSDGHLWLGTEIGLYQFDGVRFSRFVGKGGQALPATSVSALHATADGGLWVGFRYGAAALVRDGQVQPYGQAEGLPNSTIYRFARTGDGRLWAATFTGPVWLAQGRWQRPPPAMGYPGRQARTVFADRDGTLWVATEDAVVVLRPGAGRFEPVPADVGRISQFAQAPDGTIWVAEADGGVRPLLPDKPAAVASGKAAGQSSAGLLFDRDGVLWATTLGNGLLRRSPQRAEAGFERFGRIDGLGSNYVLPLLEDREGNLWVGGSRGVDRFRHANLVPVELPEGAQDFAIASGGDALWVGTRNQPLQRVDAGGPRPLPLAEQISAIYRDRAGVLWLGGPQGVWRMDGSVPAKVAALPVATRSGVQAMAGTPDGTLWLSLNTPGLYRLRDGQWQHVALAEPWDGSPLVLQTDAAGRLWAGFARNLVAVMREGSLVTPWSDGPALEVGNVTALFENRAGMWIGGERGLALAAGGQVRNIVAAAREDLRGISGIVEDASGDLWFNGARGVVRVRAGDLAGLFDPRGKPRYERFDALDRLPGVPAQFRPLPTAARTDDGVLWFATTSGVVSMDPRRIQRNPVPPPVEIRSLAVDGVAMPIDGGQARLPAGVRNLSIGFTAASLSIPERVRFRYRLEGFDTEWLSSSARSAFYNAPGPGRYEFRVAAANNDGVWSRHDARLVVTIAPYYWQTGWFRVACVIAGLGLLSLLYLARLRQLAVQIRARLDERHRERERIARELHDTLLQSTQGLILRLHVASRKLPPDNPVRAELESAMTLAERVAADGRERVRGLRGEAEQSRDLGAALLAVLDESHGLALPDVRLVVEGTPRPLRPSAAEEAYMIGREALLNAFRHAQAGSVEIWIGYGRREFRLRIRDDGRGFSRVPGDTDGHWGLEGMRERAARAGGTLTLLSGEGRGGTEVDLRIPGRAAWPAGRRSSLRRKLARWWRAARSDDPAAD